MITFKTKFGVYFNTCDELKLFNQSLYKIIKNPASVNFSEKDFTPDQWDTINGIWSLTKKGSFFELDMPEQVNNLFSIIDIVKNRRKNAGFKKLDFTAPELKIWDELYELLPKEEI